MHRSTGSLLALVLLAGCPTTPGPDPTPGTDDDDAVDDDDVMDDDDTSPIDADGDGYPADIDCDDDDPELHPGVVPVLRVEDPGLSYFWNGKPLDVAAVPVAVVVPGCADIAVDADVPWLVPSYAPGFVSLVIDGAAIVGGVHTGTVTFRHITTDTELASLPVHLRALGSPTGTPKALVIGVDGVRGDSVEPAATPALNTLLQHATWTLEASTQLEAATVSGPGWTSILTGVDADKHGITGNGGLAAHDPAYPTFLQRLRDAGRTTVGWTSWDPIFNDIIETNATDAGGVGDDIEVAADMALALSDGDFDAHFIHFDDVDHAGHAHGFSPVVPEYVAAIGSVDAKIATLLEAIITRPSIADERWLVVYTTDHGGLGTSHGCLTWECRDIPLVVAGPSVVPGPPNGAASHLDVAPTVLEFLGVPVDPAWGFDGAVVGAPFEEDCNDGLDDDADGDVDCDDADCGGAFICACPGTDLGDTTGFAIGAGDTSSAEDGIAGSCGGIGAPELTWAWMAPSTDTWTFDLTGSGRNVDTALYALADCDGAELACNDDISGPQSAITLDLTAGDEVVLVADGVGGSTGAVQLNVEPLSSCPDADIASTVGPAVASGNNLAQGGTFFASCARSGRDALVTWAAPTAGSWTFDTAGSDYDTVLHVRDGLCGGAELACDDDGMANYLSSVDVTLTQGQEVTVVISGFNGRPEGPGNPPNNGGGNWVLNITAPSN
jgi:hypothetical protein